MTKRLQSLRDIRTLFAHDSWVIPYFRLYKKALFVSISLGILATVFACALMFTSGYLISLSAEQPTRGVWALFVPLAFVQIFGIGKPFLSFFERLASHDWILHMTSKLRLRLYLTVEKDGAFWSMTKRLGDTLGLLSEDTDHIQNLYLRTIFPLCIATAIWFVASIAIGIISPLVGMGVFVVLALYMLAFPLMSVCVNAAKQQRIKAHTNEMYADVYDDILGVSDWKFSGRKDDFVNRVMEKHHAIQADERAMHAFARKRDLAAETLFALLVIAICLWASFHFAQATLSPAAAGATDRAADWIAAFVLGLFPLLETLLPLSNAATSGFSQIDSVRRLNELDSTPAILDEPKSNDDFATSKVCDTQHSSKQSAAKTSSSASTPQALKHSRGIPQHGAQLELNNVSFAYAEKPVIDALSLSVPPGHKLAILGPSGAGKSTLASLIRGDLLPQAGTVRINGIDPAAQSDNIAQTIGIIQQKTYLFRASLLGNLRLSDSSITREEATCALHAVGLGALLERLPKGLDTMVDEAGWRFSGGERHRIAIARVLLRPSPLVILDEPTVGLDPQTEHELLSTMFDVFQDRTVLLITHHLLDVEKVDSLIFIEQGKIALQGTPEELARTDARYQKLLAFDRGL